MAYVPTLPDARKWRLETDKFIFVQELLNLSLVVDGDDYVDRRVDAVETAFEYLLSDSKSN